MITLAKTAGFCYGVSRAVKIAFEQASENTVTLGKIIHNKTVTDELLNLGVKICENMDILTNERVIIRAHGVGKGVYEKLSKTECEVIDCTCPDVAKIHKLVEDNVSKGYKIIIVGDKNHPEVLGTSGFAGGDDNYICIGRPDELENHREFLSQPDMKYLLVVQTTFSKKLYEEITERVTAMGIDVTCKDTICSAVGKRQAEAESLAKTSDICIVLGDRHSANTNELVAICQKYCKNTFLAENLKDLYKICDLLLNIFKNSDKISITAGASTPPSLIKEAVIRMSEFENTASQSFEEMLDESFVSLRTGDITEGTVINVQNGEVMVNLGYKSDGLIPRGEFTDTDEDPATLVKPGDKVTVFVVRVNDGDGNVLLSRKKLEAQSKFNAIEEAFNNKTPITGKYVEAVKGGLIASIKGIRVFVPSSQVTNRYVEDLSGFIGKEFDFNILELDKKKRRFIAGRKALATKEINDKKETLFSSITTGQQLKGTVNRIVDFGAFVDLGGVDGLIHISELAWSRVKKVKDVLNEGDSVTVTVLDFDKEKGRISLTLKDINNDPWANADKKYSVGSLVTGKVVRLVPFGAFVELEDGVDGLVHISQIAAKHVAKAEDELAVGDEITVKVLDVDLENKKISLSKKEADTPVETASSEEDSLSDQNDTPEASKDNGEQEG